MSNDCAVSENSLTRSIALLRRLLGDDIRERRYIATVPTVGYRFLRDVEAAEDGILWVNAADLRRRDDGNGFESPKGTSSFQSNFQGSQDQSAISVAVVNARRTCELPNCRCVRSTDGLGSPQAIAIDGWV